MLINAYDLPLIEAIHDGPHRSQAWHWKSICRPFPKMRSTRAIPQALAVVVASRRASTTHAHVKWHGGSHARYEAPLQLAHRAHVRFVKQILASAAAKGAAYRAKMAAEETQRARAPPTKVSKGGKQLEVYNPDTVARGSLFTACFAWCSAWTNNESATPTSEQGAQCDMEQPPQPQLPAPVDQPTEVQPAAAVPIIPTSNGMEAAPTMRVRCGEPATEDPADMSAEDLHMFLKKLTREQRSKLRKHLSVETPRRGVSSPRPVVTPRETSASPRGPKKDTFASLRTGTTPRLGLSPKMGSSPARALRPVVTDVSEHGPVVARAVHEARPQPTSTRRGAAVATSLPVFELQPWQDAEPMRPSTAGAVAVHERSTTPELHKVATCPTNKLASSLSELVVNTAAREQ